MTLEQLIAQFRTDTDDLQAGSLSLAEDITIWLNEAEEEAAARANLLHESVDTAVCEIAVTAGTTVYDLHASLLAITYASFLESGSTDPVDVTLSDVIELDRIYPAWRRTTETPRFAIQLDKKLRLGCIPQADGTLTIEGYRLPLNPMALDSDTPEIGRVHHRHLVHWALHRCYSRPDAEVHDPNRAQIALDAFTQYFGIRPDADMRRSFSQNRPMFNKAIA